MLGHKELSQEFMKLLRFRTLPVGFKFLRDKEDLKQIKNIRKLQNKIKTCQMISLARVNGWTIGATLNDFSDNFCPAYLGLCEKAEHVKNGTSRSTIWFKSKEDALKCEQMMPAVQPGKFQAIAIAPLAGEKFDPDVVLFYGTPAQMILLVNAIQWEDYEQMVFHCVGESSCNDSIVRCFLTGKPQLGLPSFGERLYASVQEDELVMGMPPALMTKTLEGLKGLYGRGTRYPIPSIAPQADPTTGMPEKYLEFRRQRLNQK
jgi:uncharacterized protein (DUF169 family)